MTAISNDRMKWTDCPMIHSWTKRETKCMLLQLNNHGSEFVLNPGWWRQRTRKPSLLWSMAATQVSRNVGSINSRNEKDWKNDASLRQKPWHFQRRDTTVIAFRQQATNIRYIYICTNSMPCATTRAGRYDKQIKKVDYGALRLCGTTCLLATNAK
jgi:hypothetical protein